MSLTRLVTKIHDNIDTRFIKSFTSTITLEERKAGSTCGNITIHARGLKALLLEIDQDLIEVHPLLVAGELKKKCDYIIVCPYNGRLYFLVVELKSGNAGQWMQQCMAGECLIKYVTSTIERVYGEAIHKHAEYRYLLFYTNDYAFPQGIFKRGTADREFKYKEHKVNKDITILYTQKKCGLEYDDLRRFLV
jgi:hypothetical protein